MKIEIKRTYLSDRTLGQLTATSPKGVFQGVTLELPDKGNEKDISCIPEGEYKLTVYNSVKFGECLMVNNVHGRDAILIHKGNFTKDTHGCILPGVAFADIDGDEKSDITRSQVAMNIIMAIWDGEGMLKIST